MRLRTIQDLQDYLDHDFAWRLKEVHHVKLVARESEEPKRRTSIRAGVPLLYAHWEGFVKQAAQGFVNYVAHQPLQYRQLIPCFVTRALRAKLAPFSDDKRFARQVEAVTFLLQELNEQASLSPKSPVDTGANLNSDYLTDICLSVGLDPTRYDTRANLIDKSLLDRRNRIAHGEYLDLSPSGFTALCDDVIILLRNFKTDVENAASTNAFRVP